MRPVCPSRCLFAAAALVLLVSIGGSGAQESASPGPHRLLAGWATADITPPRPVALIGQLHKRISQGVLDPLTATVLALESRDSSGRKEQAILVSCDLLFIERATQQRLREAIREALPDFEARKLVMNATHTHTGPGLSDATFKGLYDVSQDEGVMSASAYSAFLVERLAKAVAEAWRARQPAGVSWAMSHAAVGFNRRAQYFNGSSVMYGDTSSPDFSNVEGCQDPSVDLLFFWNADRKLTGVTVNVACPSQETEGLSEVSADFWHDVRLELRRRYGNSLFVLPQCSVAGDQSPHLIYRQAAQEIMDQRRGLSRRQEIARRIANAVDDGLAVASKEVQTQPVFRHVVAEVDLPRHPPGSEPFYETDSVNPAEIHVLRLGDVALATNPFELYLDYGMRIESRSRATLTMLVQLSGANSGYLPTARAVRGGGYSADKFVVGPEGGQVLVEETVQRINGLFE